MRVLALPLAVLCLAGCADWPDLGLPDDPGAAYPRLTPVEDPGAGTAAIEESALAAERLEDRAAALRARAAVLGLPAEDQEALDEIRRRLAALPG